MKILNRILADNRGKGLFRVENAAADEATIYLYDAIVSDDYFGGVSAMSFVKALAETTAKTIHLRINCPGGDVFAGQAMAQALREKPAKCIAHIDGYAASAASWVALACDESVISEGGMVMIHQAQTLAAGNAEDLRASADLLEKVDNILVESYATATGQSREQIAAWMHAETWFSAQEAVDAGFANKIAESAPKNMKSWNLSAYANAPQNSAEAAVANELTQDLSARQAMIYEALESVVSDLGQFNQTSGKDGAHYMGASPFSGEGLQCANCSFYSGARSCELVSGDIAPEAICKLWVVPERLISQSTPAPSPTNTEHMLRRLRLAEKQSD